MSFAERVESEAGLSLSGVAATLWNRYGDERKLANAKRLAAQRERCATKVSAFPWQLLLETGAHSTCAQCSAPEGGMPGQELRPADVDQLLAELWPCLVQVNLTNRGQAFCNRDLPDIIARIHGRGVGTCVATDLDHLPDDLCQSAIDAGLDFVVASIEGATQETAAAFARDRTLGGAIGNLARLVRLRDANRTGNLRIVWRVVCYSHNTQEVQRNRDLARSIGVDELVVVDRDLHRQFPTTEQRSSEASEELLCTNPWEFPAVRSAGTLMPCGLAEGAQFAWGELKTQSWTEAFNAPEFQQARHLAAGDSTAVSPCLNCWKMLPMRDRISRGSQLRVLQRQMEPSPISRAPQKG